MISLKRILLPTDFSENSAGARNHACALAESFDDELHLLHVLEIQVSTMPDLAMGFAWPQQIKESQQAAQRALEEMVKDPSLKERKVECALAEGSPFLEIVQYAKQEDIDLIVMGTHGRSGLAHLLIGSVAENVVRHAPCPVLTVRPESHTFVMP